MTWLVAGVSLLATVLNIRRVRACFALWFFTNAAWVFFDMTHRLYARAPLDAIYAALAVWGWSAWGRGAGHA